MRAFMVVATASKASLERNFWGNLYWLQLQVPCTGPWIQVGRVVDTSALPFLHGHNRHPGG